MCSSVVLVWVYIIRFRFSKKVIKEQTFSFSWGGGLGTRLVRVGVLAVIAVL